MRGRIRRLLVGLLAASTAVVMQPGVAGRAGFDDTFNPGCPAATALPTADQLNHVLNFTGTLTCFRPGGSKPFGNNVAPANTVQRLANPTLGDPCQNNYNHSVQFSEDTGGNPQAIFAFAGGATAGSRPLSADDAAMMGTHDAFVTDVQLGSYELSNPNDPNSPLVCVLNPTYHFFCPGPPPALDVLCYSWVLHDLPGAPAPPEQLAPFFGDRIGSLQVQAGTIHSAPATKGVVNTSLCFWIDGMGIPAVQDLTLVLAGPLDSSGRRVFYTFFAVIQFQDITWRFDDGTPDNTFAPLPSGGQCSGHPDVVAHQYSRISDDVHSDHTYHVTAVENYSITVTVFWIDSRGAWGPIAVDPGVPAPQIPAIPDFQYVGQVESVPIGGQ